MIHSYDRPHPCRHSESESIVEACIGAVNTFPWKFRDVEPFVDQGDLLSLCEAVAHFGHQSSVQRLVKFACVC